ncbi:MAG: hypothetical protein R3B72_22245 [Polyangiaceae bacterium]
MVVLRWLLPCLAGLVAAGACSVGGKDPPPGSGGSTSVGPTPTELCEQQCVPSFPDGEGPYYALRACVICGACRTICGGDENPGCEGVMTVADTCSEPSPSCASCANDGCAYQQLSDTTFAGACAAEAQGCANVTACVSLNNCVVQCLSASGTGGMSGTGGA